MRKKKREREREKRGGGQEREEEVEEEGEGGTEKVKHIRYEPRTPRAAVRACTSHACLQAWVPMECVTHHKHPAPRVVAVLDERVSFLLLATVSVAISGVLSFALGFRAVCARACVCGGTGG